ncbi:hypothetical protein CPC08DRAFT_244154 [Agrocybe pediades]|nr:hypothetical protein CPC08DRAFT_244154 [Agrocybe pediades]
MSQRPLRCQEDHLLAIARPRWYSHLQGWLLGWHTWLHGGPRVICLLQVIVGVPTYRRTLLSTSTARELIVRSCSRWFDGVRREGSRPLLFGKS